MQPTEAAFARVYASWGKVRRAEPDGDAYTVYDCEVPTGVCDELGPLDPTGGDPMFIGNDM